MDKLFTLATLSLSQTLWMFEYYIIVLNHRFCRAIGTLAITGVPHLTLTQTYKCN